MFNISILIFLLISPILFLPLSVPAVASLQWYQFGYFTNSIDIVQNQIFLYSIVLLAIISLFNKSKRLFGDDYAKWIMLICFWSVYWHPMSIKNFQYIFLGFTLYYLVSIMSDVKNLRNFFMVISIVSFINTFFAILQYFNIHFLLFKENEIIGLMGYKTQLGIYQALALPICFTWNPWLCIIPIIGLFLSNSATALLAAVIGMLYFLYKSGLKIKSLPIWQSLITLSGIYIYLHFSRLGIRFDAWQYSLMSGINHIFKGNGIGLFHYISHREISYWPFTFNDPYSLYLEVFQAIGIFGLLAFVLFLGSKFIGFRSKNNLEVALYSSCLTLLIFGFGYSFMDYSRLAGTAIVLFGLLTAVRKENSC